MRPSYTPSPPAIFIGRQAEIARVEEMLTRVKVAVIYGVGGVGKSALAYALAARWRRSIVHHCIVADEPMPAQIDDVRRQLAGGPVPEITENQERILSLAKTLDRSECLLLLDDIHRLDPASRTPLIETLSRVLRRGRVIATSRELVNAAAADADRFELRLEGLDLASAQMLWSSLDELYGPSGGFEEAWIRSRGNPFLLRRAHAGGLDDQDPVASTVATLSPDERLLAGLLGIAEMSLPTPLILSVLPPDRARRTLRQLITRMIVTLHEPQGCALHDLFRGPICDSLDADERSRLHLELVRRLADAPFDPVISIREVSRHFRAMGKFAEAGAYLVAHSRQMVRHGATGELLRALEAIPPEHRSLDVKVCHARTLGRLLDLPRAYLELEQLSEETPHAKVHLKVALGHIAMLMASLPTAERVLREVLNHPNLAPRLRTRALVIYALTLTLQGRGDEARELVAAADQPSCTPLDRGYLSLCRSFTLWLDGREREAEEPVLRAQAFLEKESLSSRASNHAPLFLTVVCANLGKLKQAAEALRRSELSLEHSEDLRMRAVVSVVRALYHFEAGERSTSLEEFRRVHEAFERAGETLDQLWTECWIARVLLILGRRSEGLRILERTEQDLRGHRIVPLLKLVQRVREQDPIAQAGQPQLTPPETAKRGELARARALAALQAAGRGKFAAVDALLDVNASQTMSADYSLDQAIGALARAVVARLKGDDTEARRLLHQAATEAKTGEVDPDLISALAGSVGSIRVVTPNARYVSFDERDLAHAGPVIDGRHHAIRLGGKTVSLARRPVLRRLLYTLVVRAGSSVSKEELAKAIWQGPYHPLRLDNPLKVNVRELRRLLAKSELSVQFDGAGYKLLVPDQFVFIDQLWISDGPAPVCLRQDEVSMAALL